MLRLAVNGKFLSAPPTGVHRVAAELSKAIATIAAERPGEVDAELWLPRDGVERAAAIHMPHRVLGPFRGIPWEQLTAATRGPDRLLLNLCNIGPVLRANSVTMIHDAQVHLAPASYAPAFRYWYKLVQPLIGRRHRHILTVSDYSRREIVRAGICARGRITVVHNGADHALDRPPDGAILTKLGLTGQNYVVALSTVQEHKNVAVLMRAFADLRLVSVRLVLVGLDGLDAFLARGIASPANAIFAGRVTDGELRALYENALCLAFPSRTEGFGLPPAEAMLLGCPVVVAPCGALPEICGDGALYADPDRVEDWITRIRSLIDDPKLRSRFANAARLRGARFAWRTAAERLIATLHALQPGPKSRSDAMAANRNHSSDASAARSHANG